MRVAVVGKGGAGKSVVAGTMARLLAREGERVLALDSDLLPGLSFSLGAGTDPDPPPLNDAAAKDDDGRWRLKPGIGPARAVQRYATDAPDGIRLLQIGKVTREGMSPFMAANQAFWIIIRRLDRAATFSDWVILGDLPAGPRQTAFGWAPYADRFLLVVEPTWQSMLTARRIIKIVKADESDVEMLLVVNKVTGDADAKRVGDFLELPVFATVPVDEGVRSSERAGAALIDHAPDSAAVAAVERLADRLERSTIAR